MHTIRSLAALLAGMVALAGCGRELVGGGQREVDAAATGDGTGGGSPSTAPRYAVAPAEGGVYQLNGIGGTISFDARVSLLRAGVPVPLGGGSATVRADGGDTVRVVSDGVPAVTYPVARVVFTRVTANVTGGLVVGGVNLTGRIDVAIAPGDSVVVERPVDLGAADEDATLLIDLDASAWLPAVNPATRLVSAATFASAVKLRRR